MNTHSNNITPEQQEEIEAIFLICRQLDYAVRRAAENGISAKVIVTSHPENEPYPETFTISHKAHYPQNTFSQSPAAPEGEKPTPESQ